MCKWKINSNHPKEKFIFNIWSYLPIPPSTSTNFPWDRKANPLTSEHNKHNLKKKQCMVLSPTAMIAEKTRCSHIGR